MKKIALIFGSSTGTTESIGRTIADKLSLGSEHVYDVAKLNKDIVDSYDVMLLGSSTWGDGELQDDWYDGIKVMLSADLSGKTVAFFGCGDSESYSDTFCDAMGILFNDLKSSGCSFCGAMSTDGYTFDNSAAVIDGKFVGVAIDDINESNQTDSRLDSWINILKEECLG